jgi:hypothetical protein
MGVLLFAGALAGMETAEEGGEAEVESDKAAIDRAGPPTDLGGFHESVAATEGCLDAQWTGCCISGVTQPSASPCGRETPVMRRGLLVLGTIHCTRFRERNGLGIGSGDGERE